MKKDIVNLSKEEYEYLKSIDLNLTKETGIYFDYDLIMANIDKTPREIILNSPAFILTVSADRKSIQSPLFCFSIGIISL